MPQNRKEPKVYNGFVISMIGQQAGQKIPMEYAVAQSCVAAGTARWADDTTDMPRQLGAEIARREEEAERLRAADAAAAAARAKSGQTSIEEAMRSAARPIAFVQVHDDGVTKTYLSRPFPKIIEVAPEAIGTEGGLNEGIIERDEKVLAINLENASAIYDIVEDGEGFILAEIRDREEPEVEIPSDWRDRHFLTNLAAAKKIRDVPNSEKMTKAEAEAIIEEWTKDDTDPADDAGGTPPAGEGTETAHGRIKDGEHQQDGDAEAAARAAEKEREFLNDGDEDADDEDEDDGA